jgi:hypothetical protein
MPCLISLGRSAATTIGVADGTFTVTDAMIFFSGTDGAELEYLWPCCSDTCDCDKDKQKKQKNQARQMVDRYMDGDRQ